MNEESDFPIMTNTQSIQKLTLKKVLIQIALPQWFQIYSTMTFK